MLKGPLKTKIIKYLNNKTSVQGWEINHPEIYSNEAIVYRFSNTNYPIDVALKLFNQEHRFKVEKQYSAFERFSKTLNIVDGKYRIPETYGLFLEDDCFLMEWITGHSLRQLLWKNCLRKSTIQNHIKSSCNWLSYYHEHANLEKKQVDILRYIRYIESNRKSEVIEELCSHNKIFVEGFKTLKQFSHSFSGYRALHADIHGDMSLKNIIINESHIAGIDIGGDYSAPIVDDISQMLSYICINYFNILTRLDMKRSPEFWEIFNLMLDSYKYPNKQKDRDFFLFVFLFQMLKRWMSAYTFHKNDSEYSLLIRLLGKWRLYNSAVIVRGISQVINKKLTA